MSDYQAVVVGAGLSGAVMAERMASRLGWKVLVLEQRSHIAGNCFDERDNGILVHRYGPHLFHTQNEAVWTYLSRFTEWQPYEHKVLAKVDGVSIPLPFNISALYKIMQPDRAQLIERKLVERYGAGAKVPILELRKTDDANLQGLAEWIYQKIFVNYTMRQWNVKAEEISPEVLARVPVMVNRDDRYFHDSYQAMPKQGYTALIRNILTHENIDLQLNQNALDRITTANGRVFLDGKVFAGRLVYTGMLDQLFDYCHGELPYRSLQFVFRQLDYPYFQTVTTVNYPNEATFTRITEFKHIFGEQTPGTTIVTEYPQHYDRFDPEKNIPYYPVFTEQNQMKYERYMEMAMKIPQLLILGRLAEYKYYNMDDAVGNALAKFKVCFLNP